MTKRQQFIICLILQSKLLSPSCCRNLLFTTFIYSPNDHFSITIALPPGGGGPVEWRQLVFGTPWQQPKVLGSIHGFDGLRVLTLHQLKEMKPLIWLLSPL
ncbi:hypothetical protein D6D01_03537 [Aureobasidium pullulans]|uniref:Uncharacterized protein n=1 Tax=Aureobasidium pullulans TaxID=5580 RepID=A0A4V4JWH3_AURPU|nr:hypothetical protein D6D01_03537 [Aureobasidium pullulans]